MAKHVSRRHIIPCPNHSTWKSGITLKIFWIRSGSQNQQHYSSPIVVVQKKVESLGCCCNYRCLNSNPQVDHHSLPRFQDVIDNLKGKKYFLVLDQQKLYHQIYLDAESHPLTVFINPWDLLNDLGSHLDWQMHQLSSRDLWKTHCLICFSIPWWHPVLRDTFDDHLNHLDKVF